MKIKVFNKNGSNRVIYASNENHISKIAIARFKIGIQKKGLPKSSP